MRSAAAADSTPHSACIGWSRGSAVLTGRKVPGPTCRVSAVQPMQRSASAFGKSPPRPAAEIAVEGDLDRRLAAVPNEPRRDHLGVVEDEQVARSQQCREIRDLLILEPSRSENEEEP